MATLLTSSKPLLFRVPALFLLGSLLAPPAFTQSEPDLRRLIFEPVLLAPAAGITTTAPAEAVPGAAESGNSAIDSSLVDANAPGPGVEAPQSEDGQDADDEQEIVGITEYQDRINSLITQDNTYSPFLREQYEALADLQQRNGDHEDAIKTLENAMHIDRVNDGLFTLHQIPVVEKIIASHEALGNFSEVNDFHEYLYYIQLKTYEPDDPRFLAAKEKWADWNVESYLKEGNRNASFFTTSAGMGTGTGSDYVAIQNPRTGAFNYVPRSQLPYVLNPIGTASNAALTDLYMNSTGYSVPPEMLIDERLRTARDLYEEIIEVRAAGTELNADFTAEHKLANIAYAVKMQMDEIESATNIGSLGYNRIMQPRMPAQIVTRGYSKSRDTLEEIAGQLEQNAATNPVEAARAWIHVGDWHASFERPSRSEDAYQKAWDILVAAGMDTDAISAIFAPRPLIPVPGFAIHPYSRTLFGIAADAPLAYKGHIDARLNVNRYGNVRGVEVIDASAQTSPDIRNDLLDFLRKTRVRPAVLDGKTVEQSDLIVRFYYTY